MNSPLEVQNGFRFFFKFTDFNDDWYETSEWIGFDGAKFQRKAKDKSWAMESEWFAIDGVTIPDAYGIQLIAPRIVNPRGDTFDHMDYGLQWFLASRKKAGSEMKVLAKITKFDVDFKTFECDVQDEDFTDGKTYVKPKMVQIGTVADHLRNAENTFDAYSDKDWLGNVITPMPVYDFLYKSPALFNTTVFKGAGSSATAAAWLPIMGTQFRLANPSFAIEQSEINNTLSYIYPTYASSAISWLDSNGIPRKIPNNTGSFQQLEIQNDSYDVKFSFTEIDARVTCSFGENSASPGFPASTILEANGYANLLVVVGNDLEAEPFDAYELHRIDFGKENSGIITFPTTLELTIPFIQRGKRVYVYYSCSAFAEFSDEEPPLGVFYHVTNNVQNHRLTITVKEKPLNYVIKASRYGDLLKQSGKFSNNLPTECKRWDVGGEDYDTFVFNRSTVVGNELHMYQTPKYVYETAMEVSGDVEINENGISIVTYPHFYQNIEIGSFQVLPSESYKEPFNPALQINKFTYDYENFENEKTVKGTSKGIHTQSEWRPMNKRANNSKEIKNKLVRDPFETNVMVNLAFKETTTATDKDDKLYAQKAVRVAPNAFSVIKDRLYMQWVSGHLEILNRDDLGQSNNSNIVWTGLGMAIGSTVYIIEGSNIGTYTVLDINTTVLKLTPTTPVSQYSGVGFVAIKHFYTGVLWQTETNEFFSIAPEDFPNLRRSIKRNLIDEDGWLLYISACLNDSKGDLVNAKFLNNGELATQLLTETTPLIEQATILNIDMPPPLVGSEMVKSTIVAPFNDVLSYLQRYDSGERGFVSIWDLDGYFKRVFIRDLDYLLASAKADITALAKFETEYLKIDVIGTDVFVDDAPYSLQGTAEWFKSMNDEIQFYKQKSIPISSWYNYNFVLLNGQQFSSMNSLVNALNAYEWI